MTSTKTCDKCTHYTPAEHPQWEHAKHAWERAKYAGSCALMGDSNKQDQWVSIDRCNGWDGEGYYAGVYVGPKFGCIHWEERIA